MFYLYFFTEDSSSAEEDEEGSLLTAKVEKKFFKVLSLIKSKHPNIYNPNKTFFKDKDFEEDEEEKTEKKEVIQQKLHIQPMI